LLLFSREEKRRKMIRMRKNFSFFFCNVCEKITLRIYLSKCRIQKEWGKIVWIIVSRAYFLRRFHFCLLSSIFPISPKCHIKRKEKKIFFHFISPLICYWFWNGKRDADVKKTKTEFGWRRKKKLWINQRDTTKEMKW
jgi:hypothetical protein